MTDSSKAVPADTSARDYLAWFAAMGTDETLRKLGTAKGSQDIRWTASWLAGRYGTWGRELRPSVATLATMTGFGQATVRRHLVTLVSLGWLTERKRPGKATVYGITMPHLAHLGEQPTLLTRMSNDTNETPSNETLPVLPRDAALIRYHAVHPGHPVIETSAGTVACYKCRAAWNPSPRLGHGMVTMRIRALTALDVVHLAP